MTRLTDYGIVLLTYFARDTEKSMHNARDIATASRLPLPTVNKILKALTKKHLLVSHRGVKGGYSLARPAEEISMADIIAATEGPVALTQCAQSAPGSCVQETCCPVHGNWQRINEAIRQALESVKLSEMARPFPSSPVPANGIALRKEARVL
ncbi:MAG TPA: SUF system Fe-S cluster assembly regulator [Candidatus Polarisedimenticolia bacterium]|nr:SUF system Fe-S cluster assembly regulator [Candidatus Polarisedimenticolia bacterium]